MIFLYFLVALVEKMFKKFKVCDCFLDIVCYCLEINADFADVRKYCLKLKKWNDIFIIKNTDQTSDVSQFHVTYVAYIAFC